MGHYQQKQAVLETDKRVLDVVKEVAEYIVVAKGKKLTATQLLERFLFSPAQQQSMASTLSGGEKRRLHLLMVLIKNPNFLILDEPTNDLDLVTLAILEEFLLDYAGCLIIISHDRFFMDRIVDHIFAFEGEGKITDFRGSYSEYVVDKAQRAQQEKKDVQKLKDSQKPISESVEKKIQKKLSYNERREYETLGKEIAELEKRVDEINFIFQNEVMGAEKIQKLGREMDSLVTLLGQKETRRLELAERD